MSEFKFGSQFFYELDFLVTHGTNMISAKQATKLANAKLDEWLSTGVKVYGQYALPGPHSANPEFYFSNPNGKQNTARGHEDTHEALLVNIKPIEREDSCNTCVVTRDKDGMYCLNCKKRYLVIE